MEPPFIKPLRIANSGGELVGGELALKLPAELTATDYPTGTLGNGQITGYVGLAFNGSGIVTFDAVRTVLGAADQVIDFNGQRLSGIGDAINPTDAVNRSVLEAYVPGAIMSALESWTTLALDSNTTIYSDNTGTTTGANFAALTFPLAVGQLAHVRIVLFGITATPLAAKFERSWFVANQAGTISIIDVATIGTDIDAIGLSSPIGILISGGNAIVGAGGKAATTITWRMNATVQVL